MRCDGIFFVAQARAPKSAMGVFGIGSDFREARPFQLCSASTVALAAPVALANSLTSQFVGGIEHGADDFIVTGAPAEVASEPVARLGFRRVGIAVQ
jgi:hypothetical protein